MCYHSGAVMLLEELNWEEHRSYNGLLFKEAWYPDEGTCALFVIADDNKGYSIGAYTNMYREGTEYWKDLGPLEAQAILFMLVERFKINELGNDNGLDSSKIQVPASASES
jgi:hypothetical protein